MGRTFRCVDVVRMLQRDLGITRTPTWLKSLEAQGVLPQPKRDELNGYRMYSSEDIERIREILNRRKQAMLVS